MRRDSIYNMCSYNDIAPVISQKRCIYNLQLHACLSGVLKLGTQILKIVLLGVLISQKEPTTMLMRMVMELMLQVGQ